MACALALASSISLTAQDQRFEIESRLVLVPATVTDGNGRSVDGLEATDFLLLDNGRPQKAAVDVFSTDVAPIALVIGVQCSGISAAALAKVRKIDSMIQPLITGQRGCAALVAFDEQVHWLQHCTNDPDALALAFGRLRPAGEKSARMLDAAYAAIDQLRRRPNARRVLLLISETRDRGSETDLAAVVVAAQTAGVTVYAATYSAFKTAFTTKSSRSPNMSREPPPSSTPPKQPPPAGKTPYPTPPEQRVDIIGGIGELIRLGKTKTTQVLTEGTGGATFSFSKQRGLEEAIENLGAELHSQYVLSFTPEAPAAGYHRIEVGVVRAGKFRVRARPGYWSALELQ